MDQERPSEHGEQAKEVIYLPSIDVMGGLGVIIPVPTGEQPKSLSRDPRKDTDGFVL